MAPKKSRTVEISIDEVRSYRTVKSFWVDDEFKKFVAICVRGTNEGHRKGNGWGDSGWSWILNQMKTEGMDRTQDQLKHKWDWMQKQWRIWYKLIGKETGLGWDHGKDTIAASDEWWEDKINSATNAKEKSILSKLRHKGIGEELYTNYCILFMDKMATGVHRWGPSSTNPPTRSVANLNDSGGGSYEEGSGDSEDENFQDQLNEMVYGSVNMTMASNTGTGGTNASKGSGSKQKRSDNATKGKGKKIKTDVVDVVKHLREDIQDSTARRLDVLNKLAMTDKPGCTIAEVMTDVLTLPGMVPCSRFHIYAGRILTDKAKRELYVAFETPEAKLAYLQMEYDLIANTISLLGGSGGFN